MKREPNTTSALPSRIGWMSPGMSRGSYSRSASWTMTMSPLAAAKPARNAAPFPMFCGCSRSCTSFEPRWAPGLGSQRASPWSRSSASSSRLPSVEPSSTSTSSLSKSTATTRWTISRNVATSL